MLLSYMLCCGYLAMLYAMLLCYMLCCGYLDMLYAMLLCYMLCCYATCYVTCYAVQEFQRDAEQLSVWMEEKAELAADESYLQLHNVLRSLKRHEAAEREMDANLVWLQSLTQVACLPVCLSVWLQSLTQVACLPVCLSVWLQSLNQVACLSACLSVCLSGCSP